MTGFSFGLRIKPEPYWLERAAQAVESARICGFVTPRIYWKWTDNITCIDASGERYPVFGIMIPNKASVTIWTDLAQDDGREDTMLHELAHAILLPIETASVGRGIGAHHAGFVAILGMLDRQYESLTKEKTRRDAAEPRWTPSEEA